VTSATADGGLGSARWIGLLALWSALGGTAAAQTAQLQVARGPHFVDSSIELHVVVSGFEEDPQPEIAFDEPAGGRLSLEGVSPSVRSSISIVNGRVRREKQVEFVYRYRFLPERPGKVRLGPFLVTQGGVERTTGHAMFEIADVPRSDRMRLRVRWPEVPLYPGQRVPVTIQWVFDRELQERMNRYVLRSPLFELGEAFHFEDDPIRKGDTELVVTTRSGAVKLRGEVETRTEDGREVQVVTARRVLVPLKPGRYEITGASIVVDEVTRWQRDIFGGRSPAAFRKLRADDLTRQLEVREIPLAGRPESFAGAVGRGFSLDVSVDRSVVQVGDPIELAVTLRGGGNLETAGLPELAKAGLSQQQFRLPQGETGGLLTDGAKTFRVPIRVLDSSVSEVPPIAYSYFDPERGRYETVHSRPVALSVRPGALVTADDVVRSPTPEGVEEFELPRPTQKRASSAQLDVTGANLSIARDPAKLVGGDRSLAPAWGVQLALYVGPLGFVVLALIARRRADVDPAIVGRRRALQRERDRISSASGTRKEALAEIADALRCMLRETRAARSDALDAFLAECEAVVYAPGAGDAAPLSDETRQSALTLADELREGQA
jgi:hypothetical protein